MRVMIIGSIFTNHIMSKQKFEIGELYYSTNTEYGPFVGRYQGQDDEGYHVFLNSANIKTSALLGKFFYPATNKQIERYY